MRNRLRLAVFAVLTFTLGYAIVLWQRPQSQDKSAVDDDAVRAASQYDWASSRANLETLGRALQMYREQWGIQPVSKRRTLADAGVPPVPNLIYLVPERFRYVHESRNFGTEDHRHLASHYLLVCYAYAQYLKGKEQDSLLAMRGEQMPMALDVNMYSTGEMLRAKAPLRVLVLRLDGSVVETLFSEKNWRDFYLHR